MTSVLNVDTIADKAGTGPVGLTKQAAVKVFAHSNNITPALENTLNTASLTDGGSGKFTYNFTNNMSDATYATCEQSGEESGASGDASIRTTSASHRTTSLFRTSNRNSSNSLTDAGQSNICVFGDLA